jgi:hypothetical protein
MTSIDEQLAQIRAMSLQHYPNEPEKAKDYRIALLEQRLRELGFQALPVREMRQE